MSHAMISPWATLLLASVFCGQPYMQPHQQDGVNELSEQTSKSASTEVALAAATDTDYRLIEIVALDLLKNKEFVNNFGTVPKGQKTQLRMWIQPTTLPLSEAVRKATKADFLYDDQYYRDQRSPQAAYDIPDAIRESIAQRNKMPVTLADFKPQNPSVMLDPYAKQHDYISNTIIDLVLNHSNTRYLQVWLLGFSHDSKQAVLRFLVGPASGRSFCMAGAYMFTKEGTHWKIKWRYVKFGM